ncbi:MAG TPA: adaptor protein MecA [Clostridiales bacterium]|nr:adaptor protein MecA [Clostridiales bacterium]HPV01069.1 adaptor protein MecA [Clostridiales bacterium]
MKIERIGDNIIRVTITYNDLEERNVDLNALNYNSPAAQEFFWDLMEQAEEQLGFSLADAQLIIEPVPDSDEGFVINITRIDDDGEFESIHKYIRNRMRRSDLRVKKRSRRISSPFLIYAFRSMDDICELARRLEMHYSGESTLYRCKDSYYLILTKSGLHSYGMKMFELMLSEYGVKVPNINFMEGYLNEHGEKIIENNALEVLRMYY